MKNEMLALILAGGQGTRLGQTVPIQGLTMLVSLHSINHLL